MQLSIGGTKTMFQIEREINDFLLDNTDFLKIKNLSKDVKGFTEDRINSVIRYANDHIKNNIDASIIIPLNHYFFNDKQYTPIETVYLLPDGTKEQHTIGTLFVFSQSVDLNTRIWWEDVYLYVRFDEKYLYKDISPHTRPSIVYGMLTVNDIHKIFIKEAKERKIKECENDICAMKRKIKNMNNSIVKTEKDIEDKKMEKEAITKWRCQ